MDEDEVSENEYELLNNCSVRCACGQLIWLRLPCLCPRCKEPKAYWRTIHLSKMNLGHLSNVVRMLARQAEKHPSGDFRAEIEVAMDLIYAEIGSRPDETAQLSGIMGALQKSLVGKEASDS